MDIVETKETTDPSLLKFKVGGAALVFEKVEDWKCHFQNLILHACQAVQDHRVKTKHHHGDILYASLVHSIVQMIEVFIQLQRPLATSQVNLQLVMSSTGVWKQDAQLDTVARVAIRFLLLYKDVDPAAANLKVKLLMEFEVVWREVIDPFLGTHPLLSKRFSDGGHLFEELLGPESYAILRTIREDVIRMRKEAMEAGSSCGTSVSLAQ